MSRCDLGPCHPCRYGHRWASIQAIVCRGNDPGIKYIVLASLISYRYQMELRHLRYFCIAAEEMHIHRAAERLGIAQPPLTQQIKALEADRALKLSAGAGRGVALPAAGRLFQAEAKSILEHVERATILARQVA